jgi:hypothetical protein
MSQKNNNQQNLLKSPIPLFYQPKNLGLLWSAKAGCTFAIKWFFNQIDLLDFALFYNPWIHNFRDVFTSSSKYQEYFVNQESIKELLEGEMKIVKVVRNPYDRVVSSYIHVIKYLNGFPIFQRQISKFLGRKISNKVTFSFREFIDYLETKDLQYANIHFSLQRHPGEKFGIFKPQFIVHLENSYEQLAQIELELNLKQSNFHLFRESLHHTHRNSLLELENYADQRLPSATLRNTIIPASKNFYDANLKAKVAKIYRVDFETYGYDIYKDL